MMDSSSKTAVCVCRLDERVIGIESTEMDSKPPSSRRIDSQIWFATLVEADVTMRGLICKVVPAVTSSSVATSVPITRTW